MPKTISKTKLPKTLNKTKLGKKLDDAWSVAVKKKAGFKCEVCKSEIHLNSHHYISRNNRMLRWNINNGICVCAKHHIFGNESFHKNPEWGHFWMEENRWEDLQYIVCQMNTIKKWTYEEMLSKLVELTQV